MHESEKQKWSRSVVSDSLRPHELQHARPPCNPLQYSCLENPMDGGAWLAAVHGVTKSRTWLRDFTFAFHFHALEKEMATHSSVLAWRIPGMGEPGGLMSTGSHRVRHDWSDLTAAAEEEIKKSHYIMNNAINVEKAMAPTPVLLTGKSHGWRSLVGCSPRGRKESDTTEQLHFHFSLSCIGEGNGNPLQCSCLENPRDSGAWWAAVYGVAQSRTRLKRLSSKNIFKTLKSSNINWVASNGTKEL